MGGFAPLCPAPEAGNDELEIVVPHGSRLVSREVRGTRVWHQVLTCRAPIPPRAFFSFFFFFFFCRGDTGLPANHPPLAQLLTVVDGRSCRWPRLLGCPHLTALSPRKFARCPRSIWGAWVASFASGPHPQGSGLRGTPHEP